KDDVVAAVVARHGAETTSGQWPTPDMAHKRGRGSDVLPTWRRNDVGAGAFSRHGAKTMSGQRHSPDMAQKRCRGSGILPTWRRNDVGRWAKHDVNTQKTTGNPQISGGPNHSSILRFLFHG